MVLAGALDCLKQNCVAAPFCTETRYNVRAMENGSIHELG